MDVRPRIAPVANPFMPPLITDISAIKEGNNGFNPWADKEKNNHPWRFVDDKNHILKKL